MRASRAAVSGALGIDSSNVGFVVFGSMVLLSVEPAFAVEPTAVGYWKHVDDTGETQSIFILYEHQGKLVGRIEKHQSLVGSIFFREFVRDEKNPSKWVDGKIMDPGDGRVYDAEVELSDDGQTLKVLGYVDRLTEGSRSSVWSRPTTAELEGL